jgi:hypothetical protein
VHSRNHCCYRKAISIKNSDCVSVALVIQHAKCTHHIILPSVACLAVPYISTLSHKQRDFGKKVTEHKEFVLIFSTTFVWNFSHYEKNSMRYYHKCTHILTLSTYHSCHIFNWNWISSTVLKNPHVSYFIKIPPVGAELFHADGWTDLMKLSCSLQFCKHALKIHNDHSNIN